MSPCLWSRPQLTLSLVQVGEVRALLLVGREMRISHAGRPMFTETA